MNDLLHWKPYWTITKYKSEDDFKRGLPYETSGFGGNLLLNEGINELWTLLCSDSGIKFDSTNAYIGVGDSNATASAGQTGLQAPTNKLYKAMDANYPTYGTGQIATWKATFGINDANFAWNEFTVCNSDSDTGKNLNRKVDNQGVKPATQVWVAQLQISIA